MGRTVDSSNQREHPRDCVAQLIGKKAILKCHIHGFAVTALLDTGAQVSMIDHNWKSKYLPKTNSETAVRDSQWERLQCLSC